MSLNHGRHFLTCAFALALFCCALPAALGIEVEEVISNVEKSEKALGGMTAKFKVRSEKSGELISEGDWGREGGKEFVREKQYMKDPEKGLRSQDCVVTYDGQKVRTYWPETRRGSVTAFQGQLDAFAGPARLLGYSLSPHGPRSLAGILRGTQKIEIISTESDVEGYTCIEMNCDIPSYALGAGAPARAAGGSGDSKNAGNSASGAPHAAEAPHVPVVSHVKIWIDAARDWRIVRTEWYSDPDRRRLSNALEHVRLEKIGDIWLPVSGAMRSYHLEAVPLDGYTFEQLKAMPEEEATKHVRFETVPTDPEARIITVESWGVGKDLDEALFTIIFPQGTDVWDEFAGKSVHMWPETQSP